MLDVESLKIGDRVKIYDDDNWYIVLGFDHKNEILKLSGHPTEETPYFMIVEHEKG
jgi:hypothetical protein